MRGLGIESGCRHGCLRDGSHLLPQERQTEDNSDILVAGQFDGVKSRDSVKSMEEKEINYQRRVRGHF